MRGRLRRWTDRDGRRWECRAYDHGPFCRRCVRLSRLTPHAAMVRLDKLGWNHEVGRTDDGDYAVRIWSGLHDRTFRSPFYSALDVLYDEALVFVASLNPPKKRRKRQRREQPNLIEKG